MYNPGTKPVEPKEINSDVLFREGQNLMVNNIVTIRHSLPLKFHLSVVCLHCLSEIVICLRALSACQSAETIIVLCCKLAIVCQSQKVLTDIEKLLVNIISVCRVYNVTSATSVVTKTRIIIICSCFKLKETTMRIVIILKTKIKSEFKICIEKHTVTANKVKKTEPYFHQILIRGSEPVPLVQKTVSSTQDVCRVVWS